ncbi:MAG TPA: ABC transporter substrate-binding protein [Bdellovibrionota bacterium]|nr:ABC transporter substrate-binding protein [Bdellovibrionota bacterium]
MPLKKQIDRQAKMGVNPAKRPTPYYLIKKGGLWAILLLSACSRPQAKPLDAPITLILDHEPATLNPRRSLEAVGQRLGALLFEGLTRLDADLKIQPGLATSWKSEASGLRWRFHIGPGRLDHHGRPITAHDVLECLENYRAGTPSAPVAAGFSRWKSTELEGNDVILGMESPDPYLPRNAFLLRFFRVEGAAQPCSEPAAGAVVWGSGPYRMATAPENKDGAIRTLAPTDAVEVEPDPSGPWKGRAKLHFRFVRDENARALTLLRGEADGIQNGFSLSKSAWFKKGGGGDFKTFEREGVNVSYLAFNVRDALLSDVRVRRALALAIDRPAIIQYKQFGFTSLADSLLSPLLAEGSSFPTAYSPAEAEKLLDEAGHPRGKDGTRFKLTYKTASSNVGAETALLLREMWGTIGVRLEIQAQEQAVFFASIKKGAFQVFSSRWIGASDGSLLLTALHSHQPRNRTGYSDPAMDRLLDGALNEPDPGKRRELLIQAQAKMAVDLPYFPLWFWNNSLILRPEVGGVEARELSLSGALEPLSLLRRTR